MSKTDGYITAELGGINMAQNHLKSEIRYWVLGIVVLIMTLRIPLAMAQLATDTGNHVNKENREMSEIEVLPMQIQEKLDEILTKSGELKRAGNAFESTKLCIDAWNLIPDPKQKWSFYPQIIATNLVNDYIEKRDVDNFKKWINISYTVYHDEEWKELSILILEGQGFYEFGLKDDAWRVFKRIDELYGIAAFPAEYIKYYRFLKDYKGSDRD